MNMYEIMYLHMMMMDHGVLRALLFWGGYLQPGQTTLLRVYGTPLESDGPLGASGVAMGRLARRPVRVRDGSLICLSVYVSVPAFVGQRPQATQQRDPGHAGDEAPQGAALSVGGPVVGVGVLGVQPGER